MDNITHATLGGVLGGLAGFRKLGKKPFYRGMLLANIPDIDVIVGPLLYGTSIDAQLFHRGMFHSFFFVIFLGPIVASVINRIHKGDRSTLWAWTLVVWVCMFSHLFLDLLTSYGTQVLWPFSHTPYSLNAIFIIDPLYTIPFVVFFVAALFAKKLIRTIRLSLSGLIISSLYIIASFVIKGYMHTVFADAAAEQGIRYTQLTTTPEALQIFLWKGMLINSGYVYQGWHSIWDMDDHVDFHATSRDAGALDFAAHDTLVQTLLARSRGYYSVSTGVDNYVYLHDMRFGTVNGWAHTGDTFMYSYSFVRSGNAAILQPWYRSFGRSIDLRDVTDLWHRIRGEK